MHLLGKTMNLEEFYRLISEYIDSELEQDICYQIEEFICRDCDCKTLFDTFCETVHLCNEMEEEEVPEDVHVRLYQLLEISLEFKDED